MDVGYYISELLGQHGDVNVPGLGYFAHSRVNGYYSDRDGRFYPPGYNVQYDPQYFDDDESLAQHMAAKKKISVASAKYFTEKFIASLKQQAALEETALSDLGWFYFHNSQLAFRANTNTNNNSDPEFFGLPAVPLERLNAAPRTEQYQPEAEAETLPAVEAPQPYLQNQLTDAEFTSAQEHEDYLIELTTRKRRKTTWIFIVLALLLSVLIAFLVNKYDPSAFNFSFGSREEKTATAPKIIVDHSDAPAAGTVGPGSDSGKVIRNAEPDEDRNIAPAVKDSAAMPRYEVVPDLYPSPRAARAAVEQYRRKGYIAKILEDAGTGKLIKLSLGTFKTRGEAEDALKQLRLMKVVGPKARTLEINPQTTVTQ